MSQSSNLPIIKLPMERWLREPTKDQPWNAIERIKEMWCQDSKGLVESNDDDDDWSVTVECDDTDGPEF